MSKTKVDCLHRQVPRNFLNLTPTLPISPKGPKKCKKAQIQPNKKQNDWADVPKLKLRVYTSSSKHVFLNLIPTPIIAPKDQKSSRGPKKAQKQPKMWPNKKQKYGAVLPKPELTVYIARSQKRFLNLTPSPKIASKGPKSAKKTPIVAKLKTKRWGCTFKQLIMQFKSFFKVSFLGFVDAPVMCICLFSPSFLGDSFQTLL